MCNVQSTKYNVHSTKWGSVIETAPLMMSSPVCKEVTFMDLVTSDNNLSQTQFIFGPSTTNLWHVMGLSRGIEQVTQIDRRACGSTFANTHVLTINPSYNTPSWPCQIFQPDPPCRRWQVQGHSQKLYIGESTPWGTDVCLHKRQNNLRQGQGTITRF